MDRFLIEGNRVLNGTAACSGAKNATLPLMAAALLAEGTTVIEGVPNLQDIRTMAMVLRVIGADVQFEGDKLKIDASHVNFWEAPYELVRKMRASFYVLGPLVAKFGKAKVSLPGGCALGPRPVDLHLKALEKLGCKIEIEGGYVLAECPKMKGARIHLDIASVGATGNIMMAATGAHGVTVIDNAACEPDIVDLAEMLVAMGAKIEGIGTKQVSIEGPTQLKPVRWKVIPDRIVAGTLLIAGAITGGILTVSECRPEHVQALLGKMSEAGIGIETNGTNVTVDARDIRFRAVDVTTEVFPGFPTDIQAPWSVLMSLAEGDCVVTDSIYPERFTHVPELIRLGANIRNKLNSSYIRGVKKLTAASVMCSDLRGAAALVIAGLAAKGKTEILRIYHLDRGYDRFEDTLNGVGANIRRIKE